MSPSPWHRSETQKPTEADLPMRCYWPLVLKYTIEYTIPCGQHSYWWKPDREEPPSEPTAEERDYQAVVQMHRGWVGIPGRDTERATIIKELLVPIVAYGRTEGAKAERERLWKLVEKLETSFTAVIHNKNYTDKLRAIFAEGGGKSL